MSECKFYLVRHGQSLGNLNRIYLGHTDVDLSELGYKQAEITAEHLRGVHFDSIYSSDLKRAHNTALPHARIRNIPVWDSSGKAPYTRKLSRVIKIEGFGNRWIGG